MATATADLCDEHGEALEVCTSPLHNYGGAKHFSGAIRTVRCHEDNGLIRTVLSDPGHGAVLVIDGGGSLRFALVGDMLAALAMQNDWAGLIINGAVRDTAALANLGIGVKALGTNPRRGERLGVGAIDVAVEFGDARFDPGATLVSDEDGVVVLHRS